MHYYIDLSEHRYDLEAMQQAVDFSDRNVRLEVMLSKRKRTRRNLRAMQSTMPVTHKMGIDQIFEATMRREAKIDMTERAAEFASHSLPKRVMREIMGISGDEVLAPLKQMVAENDPVAAPDKIESRKRPAPKYGQQLG